MTLRSYHRSKPKTVDYDHPRQQEQVVTTHTTPRQSKQRVTIWMLAAGGINDLKYLVSTSSIAGMIIPGVLIAIGLFLLGQQIVPEVDNYLRESAGQFNQGTTPLVAGAYISERSQYLSDPGSDYFRQISETALKQNIILEDPISNNYTGTFYLTIPSLRFERLPVQSNVESSVESVYQSVLETKLAHYKGTGLPISDVDNNIVIYGHSARPTYQPRPNDPLSAFSFLSDLKIGDEIILEAEGKEYRYVMSRSKIIEPNDVEVIFGEPGKESLTLFTCYPNGNNSHRYVAIAKPVND